MNPFDQPVYDTPEEARAAYVALHGQHVLSPTPPDSPGICTGCCQWQPIGNWPGVYVWRQTCPPECDHAHHDEEIWIG